MSERDYGALSCWARNAIGKQSQACLYQIIPATKPSPPTNCTARAWIPTVTKSHDDDENGVIEDDEEQSLEVECAAGYDGGLRQHFWLEAYEIPSGRLKLNLTSLPSTGIEPMPLFRLSLRRLLPADQLQLVLYSSNAKGKSEALALDELRLSELGLKIHNGRNGDLDDSNNGLTGFLLLIIGCALGLIGATGLAVLLLVYRRRGSTSPVHVEPYMKQPIISPPTSRNNSMLDLTHHHHHHHPDHTYFVEYTLKQPSLGQPDYSSLANQPDIIQSPQGIGFFYFFIC